MKEGYNNDTKIKDMATIAPSLECQKQMDEFMPRWEAIYNKFKEDTKAMIEAAGGPEKLNVWFGSGMTINDFMIEFKG